MKLKGRIIAVICGVYSVLLEDKTIINIKARGVFRYLKIKAIVGDYVLVENNQIIEVFPRENELIRPNISNIDLGIVVTSLSEPQYSSLLLDKFLTLLKINNIKPLIVLSKVDLNYDQELINSIVLDYKSIGIDVIPYSIKTNEGLEQIKRVILGKTIAFMGQTGVGKSSLINAIDSSFERDIGEFSKALNRGKHQTKEVIILPYKDGFIADTPGFSSLELVCYKEDLKNYFPFFACFNNRCFFKDCQHINEPKCFVLEQVKLNKIIEKHYDNYKDIYDKLMFRKDRYH